MDFQEAIRKIEERGDFNRFAEVKPIFEERLAQLRPGDHTERGICYYYLLVSYLKADLVHETEEAMEFYEKMDQAFEKQEQVYKDERRKFSWSEMADFFHLMERCYNSLEFLYHKHDFKLRRLAAFRRKMVFRQDAFLFNRHYARFFEYKFMELTSFYGTSLLRWATTTVGFILFMALTFAFADNFVDLSMRTVPVGSSWFDYFYFSTVTMTTVGFGDIAPLSVIGKLLVMIEAFFGFLMLGIFIGMIQKRI